MSKRKSNVMEADEEDSEEVCGRRSSSGLLYKSSDDVFNRVNDKLIMSSKQIRLYESFTEDISHMFLSQQYSDCVLKVEGQEIAVNKSLLSVRSDVFRALFFGQMTESKQSVIELVDIKAEPLRHVLRFIYSGELLIHSLSTEMVIEILSLSQYYCLQELVDKIVDHLKICISITNVFVLESAANLYSIPDLMRATNLFVDQNAQQILSDKSFTGLSSTQLIQMFKRDSFYVKSEDIILRSICLWFQTNVNQLSEQTIEEFFSSVRLWDISKDKFKATVESFPFGSDVKKVMTTLWTKRLVNKETNYRGFLVLNRNIASKEFETKVLKGRNRNKMLNFSKQCYSHNTCTRHSIGMAGDSQILVQLSKVFQINHIIMLLYDTEVVSFSYSIEVSVDRKTWHQVVDHTNYLCRSYQYLFFETQPTRYIRIIGSKSYLHEQNVDRYEFNVFSFEAMFCTNCPQIINRFIKPKHNLLHKVKAQSLLPKRHSYSETKIITEEDVWTSLNTGSIKWCRDNTTYYQLSQPFVVDSVAFKFKTLYLSSFSVEISLDYQNWKSIREFKPFESIHEKEILRFSEQLIIFIRVNAEDTSFDLNLDTIECPVIQSD